MIKLRVVRAVCPLFLVTAASAQWTPDPTENTPVVVRPGDQTVVKAATVSDGSSWTGWFDFGAPGVQLRVQRLDPAGQPVFDAGGLIVSDHPQGTSVVDWDLRTDDAGNCLVTFVDIRNGPDNDVQAYLIGPDGSFLWGQDGVTVSDNADFEADPRIARLSGGDYAVVWPRMDGDRGLVYQRISPDGAKAFPGDGVVIAGFGSASPAFVEILPTDDNGFIASWVRDIASFMSPRHVHAQKFDSEGQPQWGAGPVVVSDATSVPIAHQPRLISDGAGGAVIAWHDVRNGDFDCFVQRLDADGAAVFTPGGVAASTEFGRQQLDPAVALAPSGDPMVFFRNMDGAQNFQGVNVQRFDRDTGARMLGEAGVEVVGFDARFKGPARAVSHAQGAAAVFDHQVSGPAGVLELLIVDESGVLVTGSPVTVSDSAGAKGRLNLRRWDDGRMLAVWSDSRNGTEDIYAQSVNADGSLGGAPCAADFNADGSVDVFDLLDFIDAYAAAGSDADLAAPFGEIDLFDLLAFIDLYGAGCP